MVLGVGTFMFTVPSFVTYKLTDKLTVNSNTQQQNEAADKPKERKHQKDLKKKTGDKKVAYGK